MKHPTHPLPDGLVHHCQHCSLVVPADAPNPSEAELIDCDSIKRGKLSWFDPNATPHKQRVMAVATHACIHHLALKAGHPECTEYHRRQNGLSTTQSQ